LRSGAGAAFTVEIGGRERLVIVHELERGRQREVDVLDEVYDCIRRQVSAEHELPVEAVVLIKAGSIPKTSSGKIQRHACRSGFLDGSLEVVGQWRAWDAAGKPIPKRRRDDTHPTARPGVADAYSGANGQAGLVTPRREHSRSTDGEAAAGVSETTVKIVLEEVRRIAKERAADLSLDTNILELGLDSLERMEIIAALEETFGGRFPEEVLPQMETCREVVEAVEAYLGSTPKKRPARTSAEGIPP
jgi:acyl carrier protein